jgi:hypothetical protein
MFKLLSVLLLALASAQAFATQPFYCSGCGNPYSDAGRQTYANYAHNLAWGSNPVGLDATAPRTDNVGAFDVRITNPQGHTVTVRYRPSLSRIVQKALYLGSGTIDSLTLVLPDYQVKTVRVVYMPGTDYVIHASDGSSFIDLSNLDIGIGNEAGHVQRGLFAGIQGISTGYLRGFYVTNGGGSSGGCTSCGSETFAPGTTVPPYTGPVTPADYYVDVGGYY